MRRGNMSRGMQRGAVLWSAGIGAREMMRVCCVSRRLDALR